MDLPVFSCHGIPLGAYLIIFFQRKIFQGYNFCDNKKFSKISRYLFTSNSRYQYTRVKINHDNYEQYKIGLARYLVEHTQQQLLFSVYIFYWP